MVAGLCPHDFPHCVGGIVAISHSLWAQHAMVIRVSVGVLLIRMLFPVFRALGHEVQPLGELAGSIIFCSFAVSYTAFQSLW